MAKKNQKSKAQHIRDFIKEYTEQNGEPPTAHRIVQGLKSKRINVTAQSVYQIKSQDKKNEGKAQARHSRKRAKQRRNKQLSIESLQATKKLADQLGGVDQLREHVAVLEELTR